MLTPFALCLVATAPVAQTTPLLDGPLQAPAAAQFERPLHGSALPVAASTRAKSPNKPPIVAAGPDVTVLSITAAQLAGSATDDGLPGGPMGIQWKLLAGPGSVTFTAPAAAATDAWFSAAGSYTLELSANDGELTSTDTVVVTVSQANLPPAVKAGPDVSTLLTNSANLAGTVDDDGLPGGAVTVQWSKLAGPGTATFTAPSQLATEVSFSVAGKYTLELRAYDGEFAGANTLVVSVEPLVTVERTVVNGNDDAEQWNATMDRGSTTLEMTCNAKVNQLVGLRFTNLTIPAGAVITSAHIQFTADKASTTPTLLSFAAEARGNALSFQRSTSNISMRPLTTARVAWAPASWTRMRETGPNQRTPDLKSIVQEITSRADWASGNAMAFVISGTGSRTATSYEQGSSVAPKLVVTYRL
ncbi:MAG TPA: hypothetical protein VF384_02420 [Planctomycetota bacterium]